MEQDITRAVERTLRIMRNNAVVNIDDVVAAVRMMVPQAETDAATVKRHLNRLLDKGYELPFKILG